MSLRRSLSATAARGPLHDPRDLLLDRHQVDFRRVVLSNPRYAGTTIGELDLARFDAVAGFVRRVRSGARRPYPGLGASRLAGTIAGAQDQPTTLAFAVERTRGDDRVNLAYALLFPPSFVAKIICAQLLALW